MITGIILASGFSRRMGRDKLLIKINSKYIIEAVIEAALKSDLDKVVIVYRKEEIRDIAETYHIESVLNLNAHLGQSESLKLGLKSIKENSDFMFLMGDQPFINHELINLLIKKYRASSKKILVPYYGGRKSMPTIFSHQYKDELLDQSGDRGGRDIIEKNSQDIIKVYLDNERFGTDIDTIEDLRRVKKWM